MAFGAASGSIVFGVSWDLLGVWGFWGFWGFWVVLGVWGVVGVLGGVGLKGCNRFPASLI